MKRWRGLAALVQSAVENGSIAIERVQKDTAKIPLGILEQVPEIAPVARGVHVVHDGLVSTVHGAIRSVTRVVGGSVCAVLERSIPLRRAERKGEWTGAYRPT